MYSKLLHMTYFQQESGVAKNLKIQHNFFSTEERFKFLHTVQKGKSCLQTC